MFSVIIKFELFKTILMYSNKSPDSTESLHYQQKPKMLAGRSHS